MVLLDLTYCNYLYFPLKLMVKALGVVVNVLLLCASEAFNSQFVCVT